MSEPALHLYATDREDVQKAIARLEALSDHTPAIKETLLDLRALLENMK